MKKIIRIYGITLIGSLFLFPISKILAQTQPSKYDIQIHNIDRVVYKNFLGIPKTVDYYIFWRLREFRNGEYVNVSVNQLQNYEVLVAEEDSTFQEAKTIKVGQVDSCVVEKLKVGKKYFFKVLAVDNSNQRYESQVAWMRSGRAVALGAAVEENEESSWLWYLPISGRFPLTLMGFGRVFDKATLLGKVAFHIIWWLFLFGIYGIGACAYYLSLSKIFPFTPVNFKTIVTPMNYEAQFQSRQSEEFFGESGIIGRWKKVINSVEHLFERLPRMEGDKSLDIEKLRIEYATFWRDYGRKDIKKLVEDITTFEKYPTARIIRAGLSNHEINGFKFLAASEEVDRAIENRAMMELETLKGKSKIEWLWSLAATAPLVGLFGTVTGISVAFRKLALQSEQGIIDTTTKISELAGGINEALWTTILGLSVGIILVLFYYLFKTKLDWIYGKWEELYVDVSEKL